MKIYTKGGDAGTTQLLGGTRVGKDHLRIEAYGTVDELNAALGWLQTFPVLDGKRTFIQQIQSELFTVGSYLALDDSSSAFPLPELDESWVEQLEAAIDEMEAALPPLKNFLLPGGHPATAAAHVARTVCRRAERRVVALHEAESVPPFMLKFLNRLSDWCFVLSRYISQLTETEEVLWAPRSKA